MATRSPLPVDRLVGQNIRIARLQRGLSQTELGKCIGVTFQQVQKYEKGTNRVGAGRLTQIAEALGVPLPALFEGATPASGRSVEHSARQLLADPHSLRLLQAFDRIAQDEQRLAMLRLIESLNRSRSASRARGRRHRFSP